MCVVFNGINNFKYWIFVCCSKIVLVVIWDEGLRFMLFVLNVFKRLGVIDLILVIFWGLFVFVGYVEINWFFWVM